MKKFHSKHIVVGFTYALAKHPSYAIVITKILVPGMKVEVFDSRLMKYRQAEIEAIFMGIQRGGILSLNKEEYRLT